jgi:hypothetical protein
MSSLLNDPQHWRERAREARAIAQETDNPMVRRSMAQIAEEYDRVAEKAERRVLDGAGSDPEPDR